MNWLAASTNVCAALGPITTLLTFSTMEVSGASADDTVVLGVTETVGVDALAAAAVWLVWRTVEVADETAWLTACAALATALAVGPAVLATALAVGPVELTTDGGWRSFRPDLRAAPSATLLRLADAVPAFEELPRAVPDWRLTPGL